MTARLISFSRIGFIYSSFKVTAVMPIQPAGARHVAVRVELKPEFEDGLQNLGGLSHIILLYCFHRSSGYSLTVKPFLD